MKSNLKQLKLSGLRIIEVNENQLNLRARYIFSGQIISPLK
jgi:hypothetical protein